MTTGAAELRKDVVTGDQENRVEDASGEPTATLTCDADVLALLVWGRLKPSEVLADGRLALSAGSGSSDEFAAWLSR